ncbi:MAG: hypothetical protein ACO3C1_12675 [Ilumatobacteraceae bacterium]
MKWSAHLVLLGAAAALCSCGAERQGTAVQSTDSPLGCASALGESLDDVRTWMSIAADGSEDSSVRVVDLTGASGKPTFLMSAGKDLVCGSPYDDAIEIGTVRPGDEIYVQAGDVVLGGGGADVVKVLADGTFRGGDGDDYVGVFYGEGGVFDGGVGVDSVRDSLGLGTFIGGDGNDFAVDVRGGAFEAGPGDDWVTLYSAGTLVDVETCSARTGSTCP